MVIRLSHVIDQFLIGKLFVFAILGIGILAGPEPVDICRFHVIHASLKTVFSRVQLMYQHFIIIIYGRLRECHNKIT